MADGPLCRKADFTMLRNRSMRKRPQLDARSELCQHESLAQKTLERVLSKAGLGSRTQSRSWIHAGRVRVNGRVTQNPDQWIDFARDRVTFDDQPLQSAEPVYLLLYKPKGYLTTFKDPEGRPTVYDLLRQVETFVAPVGRLDLDSSGLLLMTNDTQLAERLTNPAFHVPKTYLVKAATILSEEQLQQLRQGVELSDGPTRPSEVNRVRDGAKSFIEITISEGRNRQVRRMLEAVGSHVLKLVRTRIGPLALGSLTIGAHRPLTANEINLLRKSYENQTRPSRRHPRDDAQHRLLPDEPRSGRSARPDDRSVQTLNRGLRFGRRGPDHR
jgi:23S rRNA pseudouridine2605 synthase